MAQEMKIIIAADGKVTVDVNGVKGSGCKDLTKAIEKALGGVVSDKKKSEFYDQAQVGVQQKLGQ